MGNNLMNAASAASVLCANATKSVLSKLSGENIVQIVAITGVTVLGLATINNGKTLLVEVGNNKLQIGN